MLLPTVLALLTWSVVAWWASRRWLPRQRWLHWLLTCPVVFLSLFVWPFTNNLFAGWLEDLPEADPGCRANPPVTVVILPAGTHRNARPELLFSTLQPNSIKRMGDGLDLAERKGAQRVVFLGRGTEARLFTALRERLSGLDGIEFVVDGTGITTHLAAVRAGELLSAGERLSLVTSALHMQRALLTFEAQGFKVCPYPVGPWAEPEPRPWWIFPNGRTIERADDLLHELVGLAWYWVTDRI